MARRLTESAATRDDGRLPVGLSVGVAASEGGAESLDVLMRRADQALYAAKRARYGDASSRTPLTTPLGQH